MARKSHKKLYHPKPDTCQAYQTRDAGRIARPRLHLPLDGALINNKPLSLWRQNDFEEIQDFRRQTPLQGQRQYHDRYGRRIYITATHVPVHSLLHGLRYRLQFGFQQPKSAITCIRRKTRRHVLFSLSQIGKGKGGAKRGVRWTAQSYIRCK